MSRICAADAGGCYNFPQLPRYLRGAFPTLLLFSGGARPVPSLPVRSEFAVSSVWDRKLWSEYRVRSEFELRFQYELNAISLWVRRKNESCDFNKNFKRILCDFELEVVISIWIRSNFVVTSLWLRSMNYIGTRCESFIGDQLELLVSMWDRCDLNLN